jgi:hypothetical protein
VEHDVEEPIVHQTPLLRISYTNKENEDIPKTE